MADVDQTRSWVGDVVRSGLLTPDEVYAEVSAAIAQDHPDLPAEETSRTWIDEARRAWEADASSWPELTDHDRLEQVFTTLEGRDVVVLRGCPDHWSAKAELDRRTPKPRGIAWFTAADVWHAIDAGMLEVNLWHGTTANAAPGDALLDEVVAVFAEAGLAAHFDEGRIEVSAHWQRRP